jgi:hypothetical protein
MKDISNFKNLNNEKKKNDSYEYGNDGSFYPASHFR